MILRTIRSPSFCPRWDFERGVTQKPSCPPSFEQVKVWVFVALREWIVSPGLAVVAEVSFKEGKSTLKRAPDRLAIKAQLDEVLAIMKISLSSKRPSEDSTFIVKSDKIELKFRR